MKLYQILNLEMPFLKPVDCKIHLAGWNKRDDPLDIFLAGDFPAWQNWQGQKNFERPYIVSLIKMESPDRWLFAGVYSTHGCKSAEVQMDRPWDKRAGYSPTDETKNRKLVVHYETQELPEFTALTGRLIVEFARDARNSYRDAETIAEKLEVSELKPKRLEIGDFPGYANVLLKKITLDTIVQRGIESWKSALSSVAGIYLITNIKNGRHYIGSAYGEGGIWSRWVEYSETGHGNDKNLKSVLQQEGTDYSNNFQFSILETANINASIDEIRNREIHWKNALCSHESYGGYNGNY
jgi:hypothetical protein